jgi:hypothetical protein
MKSSGEAEYSAEADRIHQLLVNRITSRAQAEGAPLTSVELRQFDSDRMPKKEYWKFDKEFGGVDAWQPFLDKISGLLRRAIEEDAACDPTAPARYEAMVHDLESHRESFTLWACCVPAISGYKSSLQPALTAVLVWLLMLAVLAYIVLHALKIL